MPAPVKIDLASLTGAWPVIAITGGTGAGGVANANLALLPGLLNSGNQWAAGAITITRATNGDWLVQNGATVLYRKVGSLPWPFSAGAWTGENGATGTLVLTSKNAVPGRSAALDAGAGAAAVAPRRIAGLDVSAPAIVVTGTLTNGSAPVVFQAMPFVADNPAGRAFYATANEDFSVGWSVDRYRLIVVTPTFAVWESTAAVASPHLVPAGAWHASTNPNGWKPVSPATGTPVVTLAAGSTPAAPVRVTI